MLSVCKCICMRAQCGPCVVVESRELVESVLVLGQFTLFRCVRVDVVLFFCTTTVLNLNCPVAVCVFFSSLSSSSHSRAMAYRRPHSYIHGIGVCRRRYILKLIVNDGRTTMATLRDNLSVVKSITNDDPSNSAIFFLSSLR